MVALPVLLNAAVICVLGSFLSAKVILAVVGFDQVPVLVPTLGIALRFPVKSTEKCVSTSICNRSFYKVNS